MAESGGKYPKNIEENKGIALGQVRLRTFEDFPGWNYDRNEKLFRRDCPPGMQKVEETIKWDPGSWGEIPHWDHRTCDGDKRKQKPNSKIYVGGRVKVFYWPF